MNVSRKYLFDASSMEDHEKSHGIRSVGRGRSQKKMLLKENTECKRILVIKRGHDYLLMINQFNWIHYFLWCWMGFTDENKLCTRLPLYKLALQ